MPHILVIGAGISGLTTAWTLADRGYKVSVVAAKYASKDEKITSQIAAALWEWPPNVCGRYTWFRNMSMENAKRRCLISFNRFKELADNPETGVRMRTSNFFFDRPIDSCPVQIKKLADIKENLMPAFRHDIKIMEELRVNPNCGIVDCYSHLAPVIDPDQYLDWLKKKLISHYRIEFMTREIIGDLLTQENELREYYGADVIVNCTGINSKKLVADETVFPVRGAYIRMINDGTRFPKIHEAISVVPGTDANEVVFIVPRNDNTLVVGGMGETNATDLNVNLDNNECLKKMFEKDLKFYPDLKNGQFDPDYPIAVGLRPFRMEDVRVERESKYSRIVHNYGHGGSGYSLSFGCAEEVSDICKEVIANPIIL